METALVWYLVVAGPQGGLVAIPSPFEARETCISAIEEFKKSHPLPGWDTRCLPGGPAYEYEPIEETSPQQQ
jgi:hypothetical protein